MQRRYKAGKFHRYIVCSQWHHIITISKIENNIPLWKPSLAEGDVVFTEVSVRRAACSTINLIKRQELHQYNNEKQWRHYKLKIFAIKSPLFCASCQIRGEQNCAPNFLTERILAQYSHLEKVNGANVSLYCHLYDVCVVYVVSYLQSLLKVHHFQYHPNWHIIPYFLYTLFSISDNVP